MFPAPRFPFRGKRRSALEEFLTFKARLNLAVLAERVEELEPARWKDRLRRHQDRAIVFVDHPTDWDDYGVRIREDLADVPVLALSVQRGSESNEMYLTLASYRGQVVVLDLAVMAAGAGYLSGADLVPQEIRYWLTSGVVLVISCDAEKELSRPPLCIAVAQHANTRDLYRGWHKEGLIRTLSREPGGGGQDCQMTWAFG